MSPGDCTSSATTASRCATGTPPSCARASCSPRPTKTVYAYEIFREGMDFDRDKPLVRGRSTHCLVEKDTFKPVSMKKAIPALYARYLEVVEPEA